MKTRLMKKTRILLLLLLFTSQIFGQVTIIVDEIPEETPAEDVLFIVGDFNNWNPGDESYALEKNAQDYWQIIMPSMPDATHIQYKFTRGDWESVEKGANGEEINNRIFEFGNGETVHVSILNWADQSGSGGNSTAADNVHILSEDFYMPQLDRNRRIWIYLPPDYEQSTRNYPVLYMHDGQNLFDQQTSFSGEWEIDESLNDLAENHYQVPIVVGIDNGGSERINEYTPWENNQYGGGDAEAYCAFIVETLKPYVDENYRTLSSRENTAVMGSSLGGLVSHYAALQYQEVFSKAGLFSPSYWFSDSVWQFTGDSEKQQEMRFYQMAGSNESNAMVPQMQAMEDSLALLGFSDGEIKTKVVSGGQHNEYLWRTQFVDAYKWLFSEYINQIDGMGKQRTFNIYPNPAADYIVIEKGVYDVDSLEIFDMKGVRITNLLIEEGRVNIKSLAQGNYMVRIQSKNQVFTAKLLKE